MHLMDDMDNQPKLKAQSESKFPFWTDKRGMRMPVPGTVSQAEPREGPFHSGKVEGPCKSFPIDARDEVRGALASFLESFLEEAATP